MTSTIPSALCFRLPCPAPQRLAQCAVVALLACVFSGGAAPLPAQDAGKKPAAPKGKEKPAGKEAEKSGKGKPLSIEEEYVRDNLKDYLQATKLEWLDDGRVKLLLHFGKQQPEHEEIFTPKVVSGVNNKFRWTVRGEYGWDDGEYPWDQGTSGTDDDKGGKSRGQVTTGRYTSYSTSGLRFGMDGQALLNCWFTDDVEAEICWVQGIGHTEKQQFGFVFVNEQGRAVGSNFGSQPASFRANRLEKALGPAESVVIDQGQRFRLVVRGGKADVARGKKSPKSIDYPQKSFSTGRLGFVWNGGVACIVTRLEITGRIDAKKTAALIRKAPKR